VKFSRNQADNQLEEIIMMNAKQFAVRIVQPSADPYKQQLTQTPMVRIPSKTSLVIEKVKNIFTGSMMGCLAGLTIFLMLKLIGVNYGGLETSLIIGLPSALGILTSLVVF
jgi:hypothetical protein